MTDDQAYPAWAAIHDDELGINVGRETATRLNDLAGVCGANSYELAAAIIEDLCGPYGHFFDRRKSH